MIVNVCRYVYMFMSKTKELGYNVYRCSYVLMNPVLLTDVTSTWFLYSMFVRLTLDVNLLLIFTYMCELSYVAGPDKLDFKI